MKGSIQRRRIHNITITMIRVWSLSLGVTILLQIQHIPLLFPIQVNLVSANTINNNNLNINHKHSHGKYGLFSPSSSTRTRTRSKNQNPSSTALSTLLNNNELKHRNFLTSLFHHIQNNVLPKSKFQKYIRLIQSLQVQMMTLQSQIRQQRDEIQQLRHKLKLQSRSNRWDVIRMFKQSTADTNDDTNDDGGDGDDNSIQVEEYKSTIQNLQSQLEKMTTLKSTIESTLYEEKQQLAILLNETNVKHAQSNQSLQSRIQELQNLQKDTMDLVLLERKKYRSKIESLENELEKVKEECRLEVENEKIKMRKLVKVIAMKEKEMRRKNTSSSMEGAKEKGVKTMTKKEKEESGRGGELQEGSKKKKKM